MWAKSRILSTAMMKGERTFLEEEEWLRVPWEKWPQTIDAERQLWELRVAIPGIMQDVRKYEDLFLTGQDPTLGARLRLQTLSATQSVLKRLLRWRIQWEIQSGHSVSTRTAATVGNIISDIPRPPCLQTIAWFSDSFYALEIVHYQTVLAMSLYLGVRLFEPYLLVEVLASLPTEHWPASRGPLTIPHGSLTVRDYVYEMASMVDYFVSIVGVTHEMLPLMMSLRICIVVSSLLLQDDFELQIWLRQVVTKLGNASGLRSLQRFLILKPPAHDVYTEASEDISSDPSGYDDGSMAMRSLFLPLENAGASYTPELI